MRIAYVVSDRGITLEQNGGAGRHIRGTIAGFRAHGHEVLPVIAGDYFKSPANDTTNKNNGRISTIKNFLPKKVHFLLKDVQRIYQDYQFEKLCRKDIKYFKPDVIYERSCYLSSLGSRLSRKFKIPHFLETSGCLVEIYSSMYGMFSQELSNYIEKQKLRRAGSVVVEADSAVHYVSEKFSIPEEKIVAKPIGIDTESATAVISKQQEIRYRLNLHNKFIVGFVGTFAAYQGVQILLEAAKMLDKENKDIVFLLVGWGKNGEKYKQYVRENRLQNVRFTGLVNAHEVPGYVNLFHIGVIPDCERHMYPIKLLEYGLQSVCPLVPAYDAFRGIIKERENGSIFEPKNPCSIAKTIQSLFIDKAEVKRLGVNWQKSVMSSFRWDHTVAGVLSAMEQTVNNNRAVQKIPAHKKKL